MPHLVYRPIDGVQDGVHMPIILALPETDGELRRAVRNEAHPCR